MKTVKYWRWRYRDPQLGCIRHTTAAMTEEEAAAYPEAERIEGSLTVREVDDALGEHVDVWSHDPKRSEPDLALGSASTLLIARSPRTPVVG